MAVITTAPQYLDSAQSSRLTTFTGDWARSDDRARVCFETFVIESGIGQILGTIPTVREVWLRRDPERPEYMEVWSVITDDSWKARDLLMDVQMFLIDRLAPLVFEFYSSKSIDDPERSGFRLVFSIARSG